MKKKTKNYRVVQGKDGRYYPQFRMFWRYFNFSVVEAVIGIDDIVRTVVSFDTCDGAVCYIREDARGKNYNVLIKFKD